MTKESVNSIDASDLRWDDAHFSRWDEFSVETWEFFFHQAEKMLETSIQAYDSFQTRAVRFLSFFIPAIIAISAYISANYEEINHSIPLGIILIGLSFASLRYKDILKAKLSYRIGSLPSMLIGVEWLDYDQEQQQKLILRSECIEYQERIKARMKQNDGVGALFNEGLTDIIVSLILAALVFIGISIFPFISLC